MSTTESKPRTAASVACGTVAFESSYHRTPSDSTTNSTRCGRPVKSRSVVVHPVEAGAGGHGRGGGGQRVARSWGSDRHSSSTAMIASSSGQHEPAVTTR